MSSLEAEIDASFYNLVHQLSMTEGGPLSERRKQRRAQFAATQRIALPRTPGIPDEADFMEVQCHDLTRGGFSFVFPSEPNFRFFVVALGAPPSVTYVSARVAHTEQVLVYDSGLIERCGGGGVPNDTNSEPVRQMVLVGCTFIERLTASRQPLPLVE